MVKWPISCFHEIFLSKIDNFRNCLKLCDSRIYTVILGDKKRRTASSTSRFDCHRKDRPSNSKTMSSDDLCRWWNCHFVSLKSCMTVTVIFSSPFKGLIRREDVRRTERDRVELSRCFRPNDIVFAKVMSLGDSQSYLLSTGGDELGVVLAKSRAGVRLEPISWNEMRCPLTGVKEQRKTARIRAEFVEMQPAAKAWK